MSERERGSWNSRFTFILAAVGSAVGLGNAWRFPGLAAKYGGGTFLMVYLVLMLVLGVPLLMMEISIGRKTQGGAIAAFASMNKKSKWIGWAATSNAFVIVTYYAVVFAWIILMTCLCFKFGQFTGMPEQASNLWAESIQTTWGLEGFTTIPWQVVLCLLASWALIYLCIRNGAKSVSKVVKYTVFIPVICLIIMAIKGMTMVGGMAGLAKLFIPDITLLSTPGLWIDACGQVFYSLSIMMAIMIAYGSYLPKDSNIAVDAIIIAFSDALISVLSGVVMFTTMGGVGMLDNMSTSGIATAFIIYPQAIVSLTSSPVVNGIFAFIFYFCLCTLAIDSAFSIVEGVSASIADHFRFNSKKTTLIICILAGIVSLIYISGAGVACLDLVDYYANSINLVFVGILEVVFIGWFFKPNRILTEINKNTVKFKMPKAWFFTSVKFVAPVLLIGFFAWNIYDLIIKNGAIYGGYPLWGNLVFGWGMVALVFLSGVIGAIVEAKRRKDGKFEDKPSWDELD